jgi:hypothetical protein
MEHFAGEMRGVIEKKLTKPAATRGIASQCLKIARNTP